MGANVNGFLDPGNVINAEPYFLSGKTGTLAGVTAGQAIFSLQQLGRISATDGVLRPWPIRVSAVRLFYSPATTPATNGVAFEVQKVTVTAPRNGALASTQVPTPKKTAGVPPVVATETNLGVAGVAAITGGTIVDQGAAFHMVTAGDIAGGVSVWTPSDLVPMTLEAGEGLEVRVTQFSGTGILLVCFDLLRQ
jgi:hypothetical protein